MTLNVSHSSYRGFNPNMNSAPDDDEPQFCRLGPLQVGNLQRCPGSLTYLACEKL